MSRLVLLEVAMKEEWPDLYEIYFSGKVPIYYNDDIPFIVVGTSDEMGRDAAIEFLRGCEQFKAYHKHLFGIEVKSFVSDEEKFRQVDDWWWYFHPNGVYR